jgi:uncharacterized protein (UPF0548 family)
MWSLGEPSQQTLEDFIARQRREPFSYPEVGSTRNQYMPAGYDHDHNRWQIGRGQAAFEAACAALRRWEMFPRPWTRIEAAGAPTAAGTTVAMMARVYGLWWLNACRIVYVIDEAGPVRRFGFAYGTLLAHVERGEELFSVEHHADDTVWYELRAFSQPRFWMARMARPLARGLQRRFQRDSRDAMTRAARQPAQGQVLNAPVS